MHEFPVTIKEVEPINKSLKITWFLEKACNYDCSYCGEDRHFKASKTTQYKSLETLKKYWLRLDKQLSSQNKTVDIFFSGGEVTLNKNFIPFLEWVTTNFSYIGNLGLTSNGSSSKSYFTELIKYITHLTFSTHTEFFNEKKFFELVTHIHKINNKVLYIQLMNETFKPNNRLDIYSNYLTRINVPHTIMNINYPSEPLKIHINKNNKKFNFNNG